MISTFISDKSQVLSVPHQFHIRIDFVLFRNLFQTRVSWFRPYYSHNVPYTRSQANSLPKFKKKVGNWGVIYDLGWENAGAAYSRGLMDKVSWLLRRVSCSRYLRCLPGIAPSFLTEIYKELIVSNEPLSKGAVVRLGWSYKEAHSTRIWCCRMLMFYMLERDDQACL